MIKTKNTKKVLSILMVCLLALTLFVPMGTAQGVELFDAELASHTLYETELYEAILQGYMFEPLTIGQGTVTRLGRPPARIPTPLRNQMLEIWVGSSSCLITGTWRSVWHAPVGHISPATIGGDLQGFTHMAVRFIALHPGFNSSHFIDGVRVNPISQPGALVSELYSANGAITPVGGIGAAVLNDVVFPIPALRFQYRLNLVRNNPASVVNLTADFAFTDSGSASAPVSTAAALQSAINNAPANLPTTIRIASNFNLGNTLVVPANRNITLESDGTAVRTLTQRTTGQRHFVVFGNLTLGNNVTLAGGLRGATHFSAFSEQYYIAGSRDISAVQELVETQDFIRGTDSFYNEVSNARSAVSEVAEFVEFYAVSEFGEIEQIAPFAAAVQAGGIEVAPGGTLTMNAGSVLEDNFWTFGGAVLLYGTGTAASTRATLNMNGGAIRFNIARNGGAVFMHTNSRMNMTSGTISMNDVFEDGGAVWVGSGSTASGQGFNMTGGSIVNNFASIDGGGIFTVDYTRGYGNIFTGQNTIFSGNLARGWVTPPPVANRPAHVRSASASVAGYVLNNLDIIYMGHLG